MTVRLRAIRKLVVALVGVGAILAHRYLDVDLTGLEPAIVDAVLAGLTVAGVYGIPNNPEV